MSQQAITKEHTYSAQLCHNVGTRSGYPRCISRRVGFAGEHVQSIVPAHEVHTTYLAMQIQSVDLWNRTSFHISARHIANARISRYDPSSSRREGCEPRPATRSGARENKQLIAREACKPLESFEQTGENELYIPTLRLGRVGIVGEILGEHTERFVR